MPTKHKTLPRLPAGAFARPAGTGGNLVTKYRPLFLAEILGQPDVTRNLRAFVKRPTSGAFLFHGESGTGKTSAALALARELGCSLDDEELGGVFEIPSGEMTADSVRAAMERLRFRPMFGSGWRVLIVNECDRMGRPAENIWLDALEHLPRQTVVVFTTNEPGRLSERFIGRCEDLQFDCDREKIGPWIAAMVTRVWRLEGGKGPVPGLERIGMPTLGNVESMHASFRLALQQLQPLVRERAGRATRKAA